MLLTVQNLIEYLNSKYFKDIKIEKEVKSMTKTLYDPVVEKRAIADLIIKQLIKKFQAIPEKYKSKIITLPEETLETIAMDIFDMNSVEDLKKYF